MDLADAFIQSDLQYIQAIHLYFISTCVPWESNPQPFALLMQWSTAEPQLISYTLYWMDGWMDGRTYLHELVNI